MSRTQYAGVLPPGDRQSSRLPDYLAGVQGLRTLAALLVAVYHIWFSRVSGGVDVFFVVAGYFAAKSLMRMGVAGTVRERVGGLVAYWMRTLRRVTPSAVVVIIGTVIAAVLFMPRNAWEYALPHGFAALFHFENWLLISSDADYLQQGLRASPFQQFWALSVQVQLYLAVPLVLLLAVSLAAWRRWPVKATALVLLGLAFAASFAFSVWYTAADQEAAYFNTAARAWEFLAGAILFLVMTRGLADRRLAGLLGWLGLVMLVSLGALLDVSRLFPGWVALVPVAAAILIMVSAASERAPWPLRAKPLVWFGDASFAFYLWHWPILVMYRYRFGEHVGILGGLLILLLSAVLAYLTTRFVELPLRNWKRLGASAVATLVAVALVAAPAFAALATWQRVSEAELRAAQHEVETAVIGGDIPVDRLVPDFLLIREDQPDVYRNGCHQRLRAEEVIACESGVIDGARTIAVVGGSHSAQWIDVVRRAAEQVDARVVSMTKSACLFGDPDEGQVGSDPSCAVWARAVLDELLDSPPDLVVTIATRKSGDTDIVGRSYRSYFGVLADAGIPVVGIRENPRFAFDVPDCIEAEGPEACARPRSDFYANEKPHDFSEFAGFDFVDVAQDLCPGETCAVVDGNVIVYRDRHHLTRTWTLRFGDRVEQAILDRLGGS
ncbi:acyltransferase [Leucobacter weissii]|uniref:Acyltransferase n=1 Tax=Leucobacter weissii TaxID=1983706 RepID=A0A939MKZ5_9MICO|nr:acyltransferase family protein [Leucobacter weissii]MBO1900562.1 acyltransferase [Leucobacter weissii]